MNARATVQAKRQAVRTAARRHRRSPWRLTAVLCLTALVPLATPGGTRHVASGNTITEDVIGSGGDRITNPSYIMNATVGQAAVGGNLVQLDAEVGGVAPRIVR